MHRANNKAGQILALHICAKAAVGESARDGDAQLPQGTGRIFPGGTAVVDIIEHSKHIRLERLLIQDLESTTNN
eukprot:7231700-Heterocapsa_arctica.AAC.1